MKMYLLHIMYPGFDWDDDFKGYTSREKAYEAGKKFDVDFYEELLETWVDLPYDDMPDAVRSHVNCLDADPAEREKAHLKLLSADTHKWRLNVGGSWDQTYTTSELLGMGSLYKGDEMIWEVRTVEIN